VIQFPIPGDIHHVHPGFELLEEKATKAKSLVENSTPTDASGDSCPSDGNLLALMLQSAERLCRNEPC
jgi:hypothetical protein